MINSRIRVLSSSNGHYIDEYQLNFMALGCGKTQQLIFWFHIDSLVINENNRELEYIVEKANYLKAMRSMNGLYRTNFDVSYSVEEVAIQGESATTKVTEYINFQYVGYDFMSGASNSYTVELVKNENEWIVAKVDGGDFNVEQESYSFDYEKEMVALQQTRTVENADNLNQIGGNICLIGEKSREVETKHTSL